MAKVGNLRLWTVISNDGSFGEVGLVEARIFDNLHIFVDYC